MCSKEVSLVELRLTPAQPATQQKTSTSRLDDANTADLDLVWICICNRSSNFKYTSAKCWTDLIESYEIAGAAGWEHSWWTLEKQRHWPGIC